jgi:hypothetical protein
MKKLGIALGVVLALASCGGDNAAVTEAPSNVVGTITDVEPAEGEPTNFVVETEDGETFTIDIDPDVNYGFDLAHLHEHHETGDPVDIDLEERDGTLYAQSIEDV